MEMMQVGCVLALLVVLTLLCPWAEKRGGGRWILWAAGALYCAGNVYFTMLSRKAGTISHVDLRPFGSYLRMGETAVEIEGTAQAAGFAQWFLHGMPPAAGIVLNVFLYYPLGYLAAALFPKLRPWQIVLIGLACSAATEAMQYWLKMGWCEMDDVMHNTTGCALGVWIWYMQNRSAGQK